MDFEILLGHFTIIAGFLLAFVLVIKIVRQRQSPAAKIAWLLLIVVIPYLGVPLYLIIGGRKSKRDARKKSDIKLYAHDMLPEEQAFATDLLLRAYGIPGATEGNSIYFCADGVEAYERITQIIRSAQKTLHVSTYILGRCETSRSIITMLAEAAQRGVEVRMLLDGLGSLKTTRRYLRPLTEAGGKIAYFMPFYRSPFRGPFHLRNHRKIIVADELYAAAGGANLAHEYLGPKHDTKRWTDLIFILEGPSVGYYVDIFRSDWEFASDESLDKMEHPPYPERDYGGSTVVQVVPSGPDVPDDPLYDALLSMIYKAQERIWVVTPYFIPDESLVRALTVAAHRGVDVRIIVPDKSNHFSADLARGPHLRKLASFGVSIILFTGGMLHAKAMIVDDHTAVAGSANLDMLSLFYNYETVMFVYSKSEIRRLEEWIIRLFQTSRTGVDKVGPLRDILEGIAGIATPLL